MLAKAKELGISAAKVPSSSLDKITAEYLEQQMTPLAPPPPPPPVAEPPPVVIFAPLPVSEPPPPPPATPGAGAGADGANPSARGIVRTSARGTPSRFSPSSPSASDRSLTQSGRAHGRANVVNH